MKRFKAASDEEREHAQKLMNYQVQFYAADLQLDIKLLFWIN